MRKEELWEPLLKLASGRGIEVDVEQGALVRRYGLIDENGEVWSPDFSSYLRSRYERGPASAPGAAGGVMTPELGS